MLAHLFPTFWFAFLGETGQFQRRSVSPKSFHSAAFRKIKDCFLGIWELVLPRPKFCGLPRVFFQVQGGTGRAEELRFLSGSRRLAAAGSSCRGPPCAVPTLLSRRPFCAEAWKRNVSQGSCRAGHPGSVTWLKSEAVSLSLGPS